MRSTHMMATQVKAFTLLLLVLLIVDYVKFDGEYRAYAAGKIVSMARKVSPSHWTGLGSGRDWSAPR